MKACFVFFLLALTFFPGLKGQGNDVVVNMVGYKELMIPSAFGRKPYFSDFQYYNELAGTWIVDKKSNSISRFIGSERNPSLRWDFANTKLGEVRTFFIHNQDSVLIYSKNSNFARQISWYKPTSGQVDSFNYTGNLKFPGLNTREMSDWETMYAASSSPVQIHDGKVVACLLPYVALDETPNKPKSIVSMMDKNGDHFEKLPICHPESYRKNAVGTSRSTVYITICGDSLITSFAGSADLLIWKFSVRQLDTLTVSVPGIKMDHAIGVDTTISVVEDLITRGYYGRMFFHPWLGLFMRVVYLPTALLDPQTFLFTSFEERNACLFLWDRQFNAKQFVMLPKGADDRNAYCTPTGFEILCPGLTVTDSVHHKLSYARYEIHN
ncbi:MAG TPA: hypothetical protein VHS96_14625 [Bacteroidia bacterium]|nr:hypothetical protein [Bacteroidia bacterium]